MPNLNRYILFLIPICLVIIFISYSNRETCERKFKTNELNSSFAILTKTMEFMINEVDEEDPELVEFVKSLIHKPKKLPINLSVLNITDFSQIGQSQFIDSLLNKTRNGFFIESGGFDGETYSNSLFFEMERDWTGLLIEAAPSLFEKIITKNRNIYAINACIANGKPTVERFLFASELGGREKEMSDNHKKRIDYSSAINGKRTIFVPCFSLNTILKALNVQKIDYFSLDIEGGEFDVLQSLDFEKYYFRTFSIEHNSEIEKRDRMIEFLQKKGYNLAKTDPQDIYFIKN